jgi:ribonuclease G
MERESDREAVLNSLNEGLKKDRAKTNIVDMSELGLVQMTRKRVRENLSGQLCEACPYCEGRGIIRSIPSISYEIIRNIRKEARASTEDKIIVSAHPEVVSFLYGEEQFAVEELEKRLKKKIIIKADISFHHEKFVIYAH